MEKVKKSKQKVNGQAMKREEMGSSSMAIPKVRRSESIESVVIEKKELKVKNTRTEKMCSLCCDEENDIIDKNTSIVMFSCDHCFHIECYEMARINFQGSLCPVCFQDERFDQIQISIEQDRNDIDHQYGSISSEIFRQKHGGKIWRGIHDKADIDSFSRLKPSMIENFSYYGLSDVHGVKMRSMKKYDEELKTFTDKTFQKKYNQIRGLFGEHESIENIVKLKYTCDDFIQAGITMEFLVNYGYGIKDVYKLGFMTLKDLISLKFHSKLLMSVNEKLKTLYIDINTLVDYYHVDYKKIIELFSYDFNNTIKINVKNYKKSVFSFCKLHLSKKELLKLKFNDVNKLFSLFGNDCFDMKCLKHLCMGDGVNNTKTLQNKFKFNSHTMSKIKGMTITGFKKLQWEESSPLYKMAEKYMQKNNENDSFDHEIRNEDVFSNSEESESDDDEFSEISSTDEGESEDDEEDDDSSEEDDKNDQEIKAFDKKDIQKDNLFDFDDNDEGNLSNQRRRERESDFKLKSTQYPMTQLQSYDSYESSRQISSSSSSIDLKNNSGEMKSMKPRRRNLLN